MHWNFVKWTELKYKNKLLLTVSNQSPYMTRVFIVAMNI